MMRGDILDMFPDELPGENCQIDNSAACVAQRDRLLRALQLGPVNTFDAREQMNILHPAQRVIELRALGHEIAPEYRRAMNGQGVEHDRIAHYSLISSPATETPPQSVASPTGPGVMNDY